MCYTMLQMNTTYRVEDFLTTSESAPIADDALDQALKLAWESIIVQISNYRDEKYVPNQWNTSTAASATVVFPDQTIQLVRSHVIPPQVNLLGASRSSLILAHQPEKMIKVESAHQHINGAHALFILPGTVRDPRLKFATHSRTQEVNNLRIHHRGRTIAFAHIGTKNNWRMTNITTVGNPKESPGSEPGGICEAWIGSISIPSFQPAFVIQSSVEAEVWNTNSIYWNCQFEMEHVAITGILGQSPTIIDCTFETCDNAIHTCNTRNLRIIGCNFGQKTSSAVLRTPNCAITAEGSNIEISGNTFEGYPRSILACGHGHINGNRAIDEMPSIDGHFACLVNRDWISKSLIGQGPTKEGANLGGDPAHGHSPWTLTFNAASTRRVPVLCGQGVTARSLVNFDINDPYKAW